MAETMMHQDRDVLPIALWCLVDLHIPDGMPGERALASVKLASLRQ